MTAISDLPGNGASTDAFFVLRDSRTLLRDGLLPMVEKAGAPRAALQAFAEAFAAAHDELVAAKPRSGFEASHGLTASRISLVSESDLELDIRIGGLGMRLTDVGGSALWRVHARYMTLLKRREMAPDENPAGPEAICLGLLALCKASGLKPEANLELLDHIETELMEQLPSLYEKVNDFLASRNVAPAPVPGATSGGPRRPSSGPRADGQPDAFAALQALLGRQSGGAAGGSAALAGVAPGGLPGAFSAGAGSLPGGAPMAVGGDVALNAAALTLLNQLAERLDQLAAATPAANAASGGAGAAGGIRLPEGDALPLDPPRAIRAADIDAPLGQPAAVAVDTLALILSAIFETWDLPDTVKTAIGRLQVPLLKLALFDPTLFSDPGHPARRLVNGMARAACGLSRNLPRAHRVSSRLWQIAGTVKDTLRQDASVLDGPLADVASLISERDAGILAAAQPYIALLRDKEASDAAAQAAQRWLRALEARGGPGPIMAFLRLYWLRVMESAWRDDGGEGETWRDREATVTDLLWSIQPRQSPEDRTALARSVPSLLRRLGAALDRVGVSAESRQPFLDALFDLQTAALHGAAAPVAAAPVVTPEASAEDDGHLVIDVVESDGLQLQKLSFPHERTDGARGAADVEIGEWLEFRLEGDEPRCGLACWRNAQTGSLLLFNLDWDHAIALAASVLARQLDEGHARIVSTRRLFDLAAERALGSLQQRQQG